MKKIIVGAALTGLLALTGCAESAGTSADVECDVEDQAEFDSDCGYWSDGQFVFWYWVVPGQTSSGPVQQLPKGASTAKPANAPAKPVTKTQPKPAQPPAVKPPPPRPRGK